MIQANQHNPLLLRDTQGLANQLLLSLDYLHGKNITHRDLKPANILIAQRNPIQIKVTDFGLATARSTSLTTFCGSELYVAPEVHENSERFYSSKVDLWAVGVIVLELTAGLPRHQKGRWPSLLRRRLEGVSHVPIYQLAQRLLQQDPADRPTASESLKDRFLSMDSNDWPERLQSGPAEPAQDQEYLGQFLASTQRNSTRDSSPRFKGKQVANYSLTEILYGPAEPAQDQVYLGQSLQRISARDSSPRSKGKQVAGPAHASDGSSLGQSIMSRSRTPTRHSSRHSKGKQVPDAAQTSDGSYLSRVPSQRSKLDIWKGWNTGFLGLGKPLPSLQGSNLLFYSSSGSLLTPSGISTYKYIPAIPRCQLSLGPSISPTHLSTRF